MGRSRLQEMGGEDDRRLLVYLLLDVSASMCGAPIQAVQSGVDFLATTLKDVPAAVETVHMSVVTFGTNATPLAEKVPLMLFSPPQIACGGNTNMTAALKLVNDMIDKHWRSNSGGDAKGDYRPLVFMLTDGAPNHIDSAIQAGQELKKRRTSGLRIETFVALGCGAGANSDNLKKIAGEQVFLMANMTPDNIKAFFKWVTASIKSASKAPKGNDAQGGDLAYNKEDIPQDQQNPQEKAFEFDF